MSTSLLERHQVWLYLAAVSGGAGAGLASSSVGPIGDRLVWPLLAALLLATFLLVPMAHVRRALADRRFASAILVGNFIVLPCIVAALMTVLPDHPPLRLGVMLVLLAPCIDWVITFAQLGRGDAARAMAVTPLNLLGQIVLLPVALGLAGAQARPAVSGDVLMLVIVVVAVPLIVALALDRWIAAAPSARGIWRTRVSRLPVPLLTAVLACVAAAHADALVDALEHAVGSGLIHALGAFVAFLVVAAVLAKVLAVVWRLPAAQGRTLAFSFCTRNSFVILPLVLVLPAGWEMAAVVVVLQSLVELLGMIAYLWLIPRKLFPD